MTLNMKFSVTFNRSYKDLTFFQYLLMLDQMDEVLIWKSGKGRTFDEQQGDDFAREYSIKTLALDLKD